MKDKKDKSTKPAKPFNYRKSLENFIRFNAERYYKDLVVQYLIQGKKVPQIRFRLREFMENADEKLIDLFRQEPEKFLDLLEEVLIDLAMFDPDFKQFFKKLKKNGNYEGIHIIPDCKDVEYLIPIRKNLSRNFSREAYKLFRFKGRFLSLGLERLLEFRKITWCCTLCGTEFETEVVRKTREKYKRPSFCMNRNCKAKNKSDFIILPKKSERYEKRAFTIIDTENKEIINELKCYININIEYFLRKAQNLHPNDELEVLGFLKMDTADLTAYKEEPQPSYYIDVVDLKTESSNDLDPEIVNELRKKLHQDPEYCNKIIDSVHPFSQNILNFFPTKLVYALAFITSDSWNEEEGKRNGINGIIGGHAGTLKSKTGRKFSKILGKNNFGIIFGKDTTEKGLVPVAQRNNSEKNLVKRYGAIPYYNKKTFMLDEAHYLWRHSPDALEAFKYYEDGVITRALDGTTINAEAKGTFVFALNYYSEDEAYDYSKPLTENLGFPEEQISILERIDLHYRIPRIMEPINSILLNRDSPNYEPKFKEEESKVYNYFMEAKKIYSEGVVIPKRIETAIKKFYNQILSAKEKSSKSILSPREPYILKKVLRGIAAMRFKSRVNESDIDYLRKYLINTIIPFQDNQFVLKVRSETINLTKIFQNTFELLGEIRDVISIKEHINFIRSYLVANYFEKEQIANQNPLNVTSKKIDQVIGKKTNKSNTKYREQIELEANIKYIQKLGYEVEIMDNSTHFINKAWALNETKKGLIEIFELNKIKVQKINKDLLEALELNLEFRAEYILKNIRQLINTELFEINANEDDQELIFNRDYAVQQIKKMIKKLKMELKERLGKEKISESDIDEIDFIDRIIQELSFPKILIKRIYEDEITNAT